VMVNNVLVHLAKEDAKRRAEKQKKEALDAAGKATGQQTSPKKQVAHGPSKYHFNQRRNLRHLNLELTPKKKRGGGEESGANPAAACDVRTYLHRTMHVEPLRQPVTRSEEAAEKSRPRLERQAEMACQRTDDAKLTRMAEVGHKTRLMLEQHQALVQKWRAAGLFIKMFTAAEKKDPTKILGRKLTEEEEEERKEKRRDEALAHMKYNKQAKKKEQEKLAHKREIAVAKRNYSTAQGGEVGSSDDAQKAIDEAVARVSAHHRQKRNSCVTEAREEAQQEMKKEAREGPGRAFGQRTKRHLDAANKLKPTGALTMAAAGADHSAASAPPIIADPGRKSTPRETVQV